MNLTFFMNVLNNAQTKKFVDIYLKSYQ